MRTVGLPWKNSESFSNIFRPLVGTVFITIAILREYPTEESKT